MKKIQYKTSYFRLLSYLRPYLAVFFLSVIGLVFSAITEVALPVVIKPFLDGTFIEKNVSIITFAPIFLVILFATRGGSHFLSQYCSAWVGNKIVMDLRKEMFSKLLRFPMSYYENITTGKIISKFVYDVTQVMQAATQVITVLVKDTLIILGLFFYLIYLNWQLTLITLIMIPPIFLVVRFFNIRLRKTSKETQIAYGDLTQVVQEAIDCNKVIKVFNGIKYEEKKFFVSNNELRKWLMKQVIASSANVPSVQFLAAIATACVLYFVTLQAQQNVTTVGGFVSFLAAMLMITAPLKRLTGVFEHLQKGLAACESVFKLIDENEENNDGIKEVKRFNGKIEFADVDFKYSSNIVNTLHKINIKILPGETLALVGESGGGKTTLVNLITRFYDPSEGKIYIDDINLKDFSLFNLRENISFVSQDISLFNDTVISNIAYGQKETINKTIIKQAVKSAYAEKFISHMPKGLETVIGQNGFKLSGGQRQRIAIARAYIKNAPILILDEATSALDSESEKNVQSALGNLMKNRTTIVIAHRLSTIERADRIAVINEGKIAELGTHHELLLLNGIYKKLYESQLKYNKN